MRTICPIHHHGRLVAVVADDQAIVLAELAGAERLAVEAKCLYALQVLAGERPGPYRDEAAERYAQRALGGHTHRR